MIRIDRLRNLINAVPARQNIADDIGCDVSLITKHYNGQRAVTMEYLVKYANYFGVSTDYLLGLTEVATTDTDLKTVCDYTGLNEEAIESIRTIKSNFCNELLENKQNNEYFRALIETGISKSYNENVFSDVIDDFIASDCFEKIIIVLFDEVSRLRDYYYTIFSIVYEENFDILKPLAELDINMFLAFWYEIRKMVSNDLIREHKFNLFALQENLVDYAKMLAEEIEEYDNYCVKVISKAFYKVKELTDIYENSDNVTESADDIIEAMNKKLKAIIKEQEKHREWL